MLRKLLKGEDGQAMSEYGLVLGIVAVGTITAVIALREKLVGLFNSIKDTIKTQ